MERDEVSRPSVRVARALALQDDATYRKPRWLVLAVAILAIVSLGFMRLSSAWASGADPTGRSDDDAVMRFEAEDDDDDGDDGDHDDGTNDDATGATGTTGPSDPGSLTDGGGHTGPTGNTGTYTDGRTHTGPTDDTGTDDGTLTDGNDNTGRTGNTVTATDGRG